MQPFIHWLQYEISVCQEQAKRQIWLVYVHNIRLYDTTPSFVIWLSKGNKMPVFSVLCVLVQFYYSLSASLSPIQPFSFLSGYTPLSGFVIGFCSVISDNEDGSCLCDWMVKEHESSQFSYLASDKLAAALHHSVCFPSAPWPCEFSAVLLLCISPALVSVPIKRFLLPAFLFGYAASSGFRIGLCPIKSDNNDSLCLFDWISSECGSSEFSRAASANLAVLS